MSKRRTWLKRAARKALNALPDSAKESIEDTSTRALTRARTPLSSAKRFAAASLARITPDDPLGTLVDALSNPRTARIMHTALSTLADKGFRVAFDQDPGARLLFDFADWASQMSSRGHITHILMHDAMDPTGVLGSLLPLHELAALSQGTPPTEVFMRSFSPDHIQALLNNMTQNLHTTRTRIMHTIALVASATDPTFDPPPHGADFPQLVAHFRSLSTIPDEFHILPSFLEGRTMPWQDTEPPTDDPAPHNDTSLTDTHSDAWRPVFFSYLLFVQTYLVRNLVDALPHLMERVRETREAEREEKTQTEPSQGSGTSSGPSVIEMES